MMNSKKNAFYAQSGGVTAVINASACGVIETAAKSKKINKVLCGENGILGALNENFIDSDKDINIISYCFGCEYFSAK